MQYPEPTVGAVIFNPDNKILLCKSNKWNNKYVIPGGHIELGEKMKEALKREMLEETGLEIYDIKLISLKESVYSKTFHEEKHFIFIDYICRTDSYKVELNEEAQAYVWVSWNEIDEYELGGFTESLLKELRNKEESKHRVEILYDY
ncbi:MAG: NUDIX domain-containing protein [Firmicutes bacterium]|nr:NUDIX domain-containing protein [Bacillota bacterium]